MRLSFFLFLCIGVHSASAQLLTDSIYPGDLLLADLDSLDAVVMRTHTEPFRYANQHTWENNLFYAKQQCAEGLNKVEFAKVVATLLSTLKDSHTYLSFGNLASSAPAEAFYDLGLKLEKDSGGVFITSDRFEVCEPGDYLISVNGCNVDSAWNEASCLAMQEARAPSAMAEVTTVLLGNFMPLLIPIEKRNDMVVLRKGEEVKLSHPGISRSEQRKEKRKPGEPNLDYYRTEYPEVAVLKIASFAKGSGRQFRRFIHRSFRDMRKAGVEHLIVDIRRNGGGKSNRMEYLVRHLIMDSLAVPHSIVYRQSEIGKRILSANDRWWRRPFMKLAALRSPAVRAYLDMVNTPEGESDTLIYPSSGPYLKNVFDGKCYLLTNGLSGSASANLASIFRHYDRGPIVGRPPLGPLSGTWGNPGPYQLEGSELNVMISTIRFNILEGENSGDEIWPDIYVAPTAQDAAEGVDPEIEAVLKKVKS